MFNFFFFCSALHSLSVIKWFATSVPFIGPQQKANCIFMLLSLACRYYVRWGGSLLCQVRIKHYFSVCGALSSGGFRHNTRRCRHFGRQSHFFFYCSLSGLLFSFYKDALTILCTAASLNSLLSARPSLLVLIINWKKPINTKYTAAIMEHFVYFGKRRNFRWEVPV